jgi:hypothetical protein
MCIMQGNKLPVQVGAGDCSFYTHSEAVLKGHGDCQGIECCPYSDKAFTLYHCAEFCQVCDYDNSIVSDCDGDGMMDFDDCYDNDPSKHTFDGVNPCDSDFDGDGISDDCDTNSHNRGNAPDADGDADGDGDADADADADADGGAGAGAGADDDSDGDGDTGADSDGDAGADSDGDGGGDADDVDADSDGDSAGGVDEVTSAPTPATTLAPEGDCEDLLPNFCQYATEDKCTKNAVYHRACGKTCFTTFSVACPSDRRRNIQHIAMSEDMGPECSGIVAKDCDNILAALCPSMCK